MRVLLDPGHGGQDPGACADGAHESALNLAIALNAAKALRSLPGFDVLLTRDADASVTLSARRAMIDRFLPDVFLSIHCNAAADPAARGVETYYRDENDEELAIFLLKYVTIHTGRVDRGAHQDVDYLGKHLAVLGGRTDIPCCLIEVGYVTDLDDLRYLMEHAQEAGRAIADGIAFFGARLAQATRAGGANV